MRPEAPKSANKALAGTPARRLLSDREAAQYIGSSRSYIRALVSNGVLRRVELPATNGDARAARMLRLDIRDLDRFVDSLKG